MEFKDFMKALLEGENQKSKRQKFIEENGVDPKTISHYGGEAHGGQTIRMLESSDQVGTRGGKDSRRRTARVWRPVRPETD